MSGDTRELYQELILDHGQRPRNNRSIPGATATVQGDNPLCGDRITLYVVLDGDRIQDAAFEGSGCAISRASASLMTTTLKGKTRAEARALFDQFHSVVTGRTERLEELGKLAVFAGVATFPARVKCATLPWHTLNAALEGKHERVSTE